MILHKILEELKMMQLSPNSQLSSSKAIKEGFRIWLLELSHNKMVVST